MDVFLDSGILGGKDCRVAERDTTESGSRAPGVVGQRVRHRVVGTLRGCPCRDQGKEGEPPQAEPNLRVPPEPSRKRLHPGDLFTASPAPETFVFGQVVRPDAVLEVPITAVLIYIYDSVANHPVLPEVDHLIPQRLLFAPLFINRLPWSRGYFQTLSHRDLTTSDVLPRHCFRTPSGGVVDDDGNVVSNPTDPIGRWGLESFRTVDDRVCTALGIPLAPE